MEQYIYIFTILLEIAFCIQAASAILKLDKKVTQINLQVVDIKQDVDDALIAARKLIKKFNKIAGLIVRIKYSKTKKIIIAAFDIISLFMLFKSFKAYRGLKKLKLVKKLFSYSVIRGLFSCIKQFV